LLAVAEDMQVAVFRTPMVTMRFINAATIAMEVDFSPSVTEFGSMVDILGVGSKCRTGNFLSSSTHGARA
jgi:HPr kinase/phosphorylase